MILEINRFIDPIVKLLGEEFGWLSELSFGSVLIRLILVILFSGIIGIERAAKRQEAGLRTYILVCLGAATAMLTNQFIFETFNTGDVGRIAAQVISGIGFLGAGTILITSRNQIKGLTTAAGLWACACLGLALGIGFYTLSIVGFFLIMVTLFFMSPLEKVLTKYSNIHRFYIELEARTDLKDLVNYLRSLNLNVRSIERNSAYANSGLSVYTISLRKNNKTKINEEFFESLKKLPYVNFVEEIF